MTFQITWQGSTIELLFSLVKINPSAAIRVLRSTRPKGVRSDTDEFDKDRRRALAAAHVLLGRPERAQRLKAADLRATATHDQSDPLLAEL